MSQNNLFSESFFRFPSIPNIVNTLQLIQTQKNFSPSSTVSLDQNISQHLLELDQLELSIDEKMPSQNHEVTTSTSISKKKRSGCTCKKTKCLKMYCECFRMGKMCTEDCNCYGCSNDQGHEHQLKKARESISHKLQHARHQGKGCNCKKSQCQKKYCECFNSGIACGQSCKCEDCANGTCEDHGNSSASKSLPMMQFDIDSVMYALES